MILYRSKVERSQVNISFRWSEPPLTLYLKLISFKQSREEVFDSKTPLQTFPTARTTSMTNFMQFGAVIRNYVFRGFIFIYI